MAYYNNTLDDEEKDNSQGMNATATPAAAPTDAPVQLSNQSAVAATGTPTQPKVPKAASSGAAPAFQSYTKANQGTAQNKLNNAATSAVANAGQSANNALNQATDQFGKKVDAGSLANREKALQDVSNTIASTRKATLPPPVAPAQATMSTPGTSGADKNANSPMVNKDGTPITGPLPVIDPGHNQNRNVTPTSPGTTAPTGPAPLDLSGIQGVDRFKEVINAQYQGPESLRQSGLYNNAAAKVGSATNLINNSKTATGREEMLKNMYSKRADYTSGLNKLDSALLNSNKQGVQALQNTAQAQGNLSQSLDKAQVNSANLATNRTAEIDKIRNDSKTLFNTEKGKEEAATEERMDKMIKTPLTNPDGSVMMKADGTPMTQWDQLSESYKDIIRNKGTDNAGMLNTKTQEYTEANKANYVDPGVLQKAKDAAAISFLTQDRNAKANYEALLAKSNAYNSGLEQVNKQYNNPNSVNFSDEEANFLGINAGEGFYNAGADVIKKGEADRTKLISKDEQYRQAALAQLAGLDSSNFLNTNLAYKDANAAGTQSIMDSIDLKGTRDALNAQEKTFQQNAKDNNIKGFGMKKEKTSGNKYYAEDSANLAEVLKAEGYNFDGGEKGYTGNAAALNNIGNASNMSSLNDAGSMVGNGVSSQMNGFTGGDSNTAVGQAGNVIGSLMGANVLTGALGLGGAGDAIDKLFGGGADVGAAKAQARTNARKDLGNNVKGALETAGFSNRANVVDNEKTQARKLAMEQLMKSFDQTNRNKG